MPRETVTQSEFRKLECNRCGACCEKFNLMSPMHFALDGGLNKAMREYNARSVQPDGIREITQPWSEFARWFGELVPLDADCFAGQSFYRCSHLTFDPESGLSGCGIYETRPVVCQGYPYGKTASPEVGYFRCSYNVDVVMDPEDEAYLRKLAAEPAMGEINA